MGLGFPGQDAISSTVATTDCEELLDPTAVWEWQLSRFCHGSMGLPASSFNFRMDLEEISERGYPVPDPCLFSHSGWYIGKANLSRSLGGASMLGLQMRCVEHLRGLLVPAYRDASLPRYGILRRSVGSVCFLPLLCCAHEVQALAVESALIRALAPSCNGADAALALRQSQLLRRTVLQSENDRLAASGGRQE